MLWPALKATGQNNVATTQPQLFTILIPFKKIISKPHTPISLFRFAGYCRKKRIPHVFFLNKCRHRLKNRSGTKWFRMKKGEAQPASGTYKALKNAFACYAFQLFLPRGVVFDKANRNKTNVIKIYGIVPVNPAPAVQATTYMFRKTPLPPVNDKHRHIPGNCKP